MVFLEEGAFLDNGMGYVEMQDSENYELIQRHEDFMIQGIIGDCNKLLNTRDQGGLFEDDLGYIKELLNRLSWMVD